MSNRSVTRLFWSSFHSLFGLPVLGIRFSPNVAALVGLSIYNGAYVTEILRAGIQAIHRSQIEARLSIGMSRLQVFLYIVAVPALEKVYPALRVILSCSCSVRASYPRSARKILQRSPMRFSQRISASWRYTSSAPSFTRACPGMEEPISPPRQATVLLSPATRRNPRVTE
jgi:Binding-protein-dependent transport system inner membrane component